MNVLRIDASARTEGSASRALADAAIESLAERAAAAGESFVVVRRDLALDPPPLLTPELVADFNTPEEERSAAQRARLGVSAHLVDELRAADVLILATPIYNFGVPAALKAWIDLVVRARETFRYGPNGPEGLLDVSRAIVLVASGGTAVDSEIDFATPYLRRILGFIGIDEVEVFAADGLVRGGAEKLESARRTVLESAGQSS